MSANQGHIEPLPYPADPASVRWDAAFAMTCGVWFVGLLLVGGDGPLGAGAVLLAQVVAAAALYVYARPRTGKVVAFGIGIAFLSLVAAAANPIAEANAGLPIAAAAGAWAMVVLLGPPPIRGTWLASVLLLVAVASSGVALAFLAAAVAALLPRPRRIYLWVVVPALLAAAWSMAVGAMSRLGLTESGDVLTEAGVGIAEALGQVSGLGPRVGLILAVLLGIATVTTIWFSDSKRLGLIAGSVGLVAEYALLALFETEVGIESAPDPSLVLPAAVFVFIALASWLAHRPLDQPGRRLRLVAMVSSVVLIAVMGHLSDGLTAPRLSL